METENFQAPFRVITLGSIQIENIIRLKVYCLAALKFACYQNTQVQTEDDNTNLVLSRIKH